MPGAQGARAQGPRRDPREAQGRTRESPGPKDPNGALRTSHIINRERNGTLPCNDDPVSCPPAEGPARLAKLMNMVHGELNLNAARLKNCILPKAIRAHLAANWPLANR